MDSAISMVVEAALRVIFQLLAPPFLESLGLPFGVEQKAKRLKLTHSKIEALLIDAEERQIKEESVRLWLSDLKHVAYDAEDIFNELEYRALRSKIEEAPIQTRKRKLTDLFRVTHFFSRFSSNFELGSRIKKIRESLAEIERESNQFHRKVINGSRSEMLRMRPPTSSIVDESIVFGREADREKVVGLLALDDSSASDSGIQVVPICGMGGLGKTTLAQLIHNDERVKKHFDVSVWVYVSEDFDLIRLFKVIAESVLRGSDPRLTSLDAIQVSIQRALKGKRLFLVLDDVWKVNYNHWDALRAPLMVAGRESRILVTTRSHGVSSMMGTVPTHSLCCLSDDDCWSIFKRLAFVQGDSDAHPDLVKIGKQIVKKCNGLPLAVKTLGGLLRSVVDVVQWEKILKSEIWDLPEERNDILPALRLSYHHLPAHLKRCFAYCACLFRKGRYRAVRDNELILKWMAQGFIIQPKGSTSVQMEDIGREYLADLVSRSLLNCEEDDDDDEILYYTMHDLTHDLARSVLGADFWKRGDEKSHGNNAEKARYMSDEPIISRNFDFYCLKNLRTLSLVCSENILADLFVTLRHIRTLQLHGHIITELPESIGDLLQLRYLHLSHNKIERIPKSTTRLYNLQTLRLDGCINLVEVPESIGDLLQLRYLDLSRTKIERLPKSTTRLYNLQTLRLDGCRKLVEVPESIGDLLQLRYLDLSYTKIERLPKSTTRLYNLQTLSLQYCSKLVEVPSGFSNLVNLRRIILDGCSASIPFGGLKSLRELEQPFKVGREIGYRVNELRDMEHLEGSLHISELQNVSSVEEAKEAELKNKQKIEFLALHWEYYDVDSGQEGIEEEVLNALQPHTNLKELRIDGYFGDRFPTWLEDSSCSKLVRISLATCLCCVLPPFGQLPSLKYLSLHNVYGLEKVGREVYGDGMVKGFPSLERLCMWSMPDLEEWTALEGDMIHVCQVSFWDCSKLRVLPDHFPLTLKRLSTHNCPLVTEKCKEGGEYWSKISHIPDLCFN